MTDMIKPFEDSFNVFVGALGGVFVWAFGEHWPLFLAFLLLNVGDWASRWIAARITGTEDSHKAWVGILRKIGYWLMIALAFGMSAIFEEIGMIIGIGFEFTEWIGWFVLISLLINEIRSILENLVDGGFELPAALVKGLKVANKVMDELTEDDEELDS